MAMTPEELFITMVNFLSAEPAIFALTATVFILVIFSVHLSIRLGRLTRGGDGRSLEGTIKTLGERTSILESYARKNKSTVIDMERRLARAIQGVAVERFDPFKQQGGQQSFASALLNEHGNGVVISGIHSRDQVRVYAKPVQEFASERELSEEEIKAIERAKRELE